VAIFKNYIKTNIQITLTPKLWAHYPNFQRLETTTTQHYIQQATDEIYLKFKKCYDVHYTLVQTK
jgi:hypothetical protein